jgi:hypothetical protein
MALELRNRLQQNTGLALPTTVAFDHPSLAKLADFLCSLVAPTSATWADSAIRRKLATVSIRSLRESGLIAALMSQPDESLQALDPDDDLVNDDDVMNALEDQLRIRND